MREKISKCVVTCLWMCALLATLTIEDVQSRVIARRALSDKDADIHDALNEAQKLVLQPENATRSTKLVMQASPPKLHNVNGRGPEIHLIESQLESTTQSQPGIILNNLGVENVVTTKASLSPLTAEDSNEMQHVFDNSSSWHQAKSNSSTVVATSQEKLLMDWTQIVQQAEDKLVGNSVESSTPNERKSINEELLEAKSTKLTTFLNNKKVEQNLSATPLTTFFKDQPTMTTIIIEPTLSSTTTSSVLSESDKNDVKTMTTVPTTTISTTTTSTTTTTTTSPTTQSSIVLSTETLGSEENKNELLLRNKEKEESKLRATTTISEALIDEVLNTTLSPMSSSTVSSSTPTTVDVTSSNSEKFVNRDENLIVQAADRNKIEIEEILFSTIPTTTETNPTLSTEATKIETTEKIENNLDTFETSVTNPIDVSTHTTTSTASTTKTTTPLVPTTITAQIQKSYPVTTTAAPIETTPKSIFGLHPNSTGTTNETLEHKEATDGAASDAVTDSLSIQPTANAKISQSQSQAQSSSTTTSATTSTSTSQSTSTIITTTTTAVTPTKTTEIETKAKTKTEKEKETQAAETEIEQVTEKAEIKEPVTVTTALRTTTETITEEKSVTETVTENLNNIGTTGKSSTTPEFEVLNSNETTISSISSTMPTVSILTTKTIAAATSTISNENENATYSIFEEMTTPSTVSVSVETSTSVLFETTHIPTTTSIPETTNLVDVDIAQQETTLPTIFETTPAFKAEIIETTSSKPFIHEMQFPKSTPDGKETDVNVVIAISVSVIGVVALILLVAFLYLMRKRQKQTSMGLCHPVILSDNISILGSIRKPNRRGSRRSYGNAAFQDPALAHNVIKSASDLAEFVKRRSQIFEEFRDVPQIIARASEIPRGCEDKNRYANVIPLPETRVLLQRQNDDETTEYINANYVTCTNDKPNYYIACQAPLDSTVQDFWRMIWEQQSRVIIQACNLIEGGKEKCAEYLPPSVTLDNHTTFGEFQITLKNREVKDKYAISTLLLKNVTTNESREITHYWYEWPETGVPTEEAPIIAMLLEVRSSLKSYAIEMANDLKEKSNGAGAGAGVGATTSSGSGNRGLNENIAEKTKKFQGPLTIHCSPGTGRTGAIIACDMAIRSLETTKSLDIPQIIYDIRRGRASAVQTKEQYEFIYKVANVYAMKITNILNDNPNDN